MPWGYVGSYGRNARTNFKRSSFDWKLKVVVHFSRVKCDQRAVKPPLPDALFLSNASDKNFEIAILLKIFQRSDKKKIGVSRVPHGPGAGAVSYALWVFMIPMRNGRINFRERAHLFGK